MKRSPGIWLETVSGFQCSAPRDFWRFESNQMFSIGLNCCFLSCTPAIACKGKCCFTAVPGRHFNYDPWDSHLHPWPLKSNGKTTPVGIVSILAGRSPSLNRGLLRPNCAAVTEASSSQSARLFFLFFFFYHISLTILLIHLNYFCNPISIVINNIFPNWTAFSHSWITVST